MIVQVEFILSAISIYLFLYFTVQNIYPTLTPTCCFFELWEEGAGVNHALCFEQQMIAFGGIVMEYVQGGEVASVIRCLSLASNSS